jgi:drug/metabolite transporter (DMT)-like permease
VTRRGWLLFASMCVIWGVPYLMIRVAVRELSPAMLVLLRTGIAAALLVPIAASRRELRPLLRWWRPLVLFAGIEIAIPWLFLARAEQHLTSSLAGLLIAAVPLVGAAVSVATGGNEGLGGRRLLGLVVGLVGVAALVGIDVGEVNVVALLEIGIVVLGYAVGPILLSRTLDGAPALGIVAASLALTAIVYLPFALLTAPDRWPSGRVVASVVGLAVLCTAIAFLLFFALIADVGPVRATVITYVNPAVAAILGVAVLSENVTLGMGVGFALILVGSVLATGRARTTTRRDLEPAPVVAEP